MKKKEAIEKFKNGYNCAQSVFSVFAEDLNLSSDSALKIASPFGSGIAYMQETCGAVTGALMVIGLKYGRGINGTQKDKERAYDLSKHFMAQFKEKFGCVNCLQLMERHNMSTTEGMQKILELDLFRLKCVKHIEGAICITENILEKIENK
jgi:C_GCAxxG_C_C family probable redox protein